MTGNINCRAPTNIVLGLVAAFFVISGVTLMVSEPETEESQKEPVTVSGTKIEIDCAVKTNNENIQGICADYGFEMR